MGSSRLGFIASLEDVGVDGVFGILLFTDPLPVPQFTYRTSVWAAVDAPDVSCECGTPWYPMISHSFNVCPSFTYGALAMCPYWIILPVSGFFTCTKLP